MKLKALNRVEGVKVLTGKGKGGTTAYAGNIFETTSTAEAERLIDLGAAEKYVVKDELADENTGEGSTPKKASTKKTTAKKTTAKKTGGAQKAEDGSDTADESDLGLGE